MRELSFVIAVPLTVLAYNISMKMDSRNIDQLIQGILIALIVLAVVVPTGLYVLAYLRDRRAQGASNSGWARSMTRPQRDISPYHATPNAWSAPSPAGYWHTAPLPPPYQAPAQPQGSFIVQQPPSFQQEDWS